MIEWIKNRIPEGQYQNKTEAEDETMGLIKAAKDAVSSMLADQWRELSLIQNSDPTRPTQISYPDICM